MARPKWTGGGTPATLGIVLITVVWATFTLLKIPVPALDQVFTASWGIWFAQIAVERERERRRRDDDRDAEIVERVERRVGERSDSSEGGGTS